MNDKISLLGWPNGVKIDPCPRAFIHSFEISTEDSIENFITFYSKQPIDKPRLDKLLDILPSPNYHDDSIFHREGDENRPFSARDFHYHVLFDDIPTKEDFKMVASRLEQAGLRVNKPLVEEYLNAD